MTFKYEEYNKSKKARIPKYTAKKVWFVNGDLCSIHHKLKSERIVTLYNWNTDSLLSMTYADFNKYKKKAYTITEASELLHRHHFVMSRYITQGIIPPPRGRGLNGERPTPKAPAYYSEKDLYEIRDILSQIHIGRARKDGLITNNSMPSEKELRYAINQITCAYVKDEHGREISVLSDDILDM